MKAIFSLGVCAFAGALACNSLVAQDSASIPSSLSNDIDAPSQQAQSLGDAARKMRKDITTEVKMTPEDTKKLFEAVDKILAFASQDSGFPKHGTVKRQLVSREEVEKYTSDQFKKAQFLQRLGRSELTMKKFGFLPRDFNLREFLVKANGSQIAGYYDPETKSISMLNWVPPDRQEPILAHELTHALQDQNYGLKTWMQGTAAKERPGDRKLTDPDDESAAARKAVVEGQAMVVYVDYLLAPYGRTLKNTPGLIYQMEDPAVKATIESQMIHDAPIILREAGTFPYKEGLIFEGEVLQEGDKQMAFAGVFARPPRNSHEVLQPRAYLNREALSAVHIPDLSDILHTQYEVYDAGDIGELDVRALLKQYATGRVADDLSSAWRGGAYTAFRKTAATAGGDPTTADLALVYESHWKSPESAAYFARFYASTVSKRYRTTVSLQSGKSCVGKQCPLSSVQISTEEGPVIIEQWADNRVVVCESFDQTLADKLHDALRDNTGEVHAQNLPADELGFRLYSIPAFQEFSEHLGAQVIEDLQSRASAF
jgi:hypothetical protein